MMKNTIVHKVTGEIKQFAMYDGMIKYLLSHSGWVKYDEKTYCTLCGTQYLTIDSMIVSGMCDICDKRKDG